MIDLRIQLGTRPMACAHRGGLRTAPENTLGALRQCRELGAGAAEIDVRLTLDNRLVLMHDARIDRTTSGAGLVESKSLAEISHVDCGAWFGPQWAGERVPTLEDAISVATEIGLILRVELKTYGRDEAVLRELERVVIAAAAPPVVLCSFDHVQLAACRRRLPDIATMGLVQLRTPAVGAIIKMADLQGISVKDEWFDEAMAVAAHTAGAAVSCAFPLPRDPSAPDAEEFRRIERIRAWCGEGLVDMLTTDDVRGMSELLRGKSDANPTPISI